MSSNNQLIKNGSGTLTLGAANTYNAGTTINAGTLLANSPAGSATGPGAVNVQGGTLGGTGAVAGATTVNAGSFAPGALLGSSWCGDQPAVRATATTAQTTVACS